MVVERREKGKMEMRGIKGGKMEKSSEAKVKVEGGLYMGDR